MQFHTAVQESTAKENCFEHLPVQIVRSLVQKGVILSDKLSPDKLGTWLLHHHFFGQLVLTETKRL